MYKLAIHRYQSWIDIFNQLSDEEKTELFTLARGRAKKTYDLLTGPHVHKIAMNGVGEVVSAYLQRNGYEVNMQFNGDYTELGILTETKAQQAKQWNI